MCSLYIETLNEGCNRKPLYKGHTLRPQRYSETSLSGHSVRRPPLYRGHLCKSPMLLFLYIFTSVKRPPHYKGQFCMALCDRYKEVSLYLLVHFNLRREDNLSIKAKMAGPKCVHYSLYISSFRTFTCQNVVKS